MGRYLSGRAVNLTHTFLDDELALTPTTVTVTVTRAGATAPATSGPATKTGNVYTYSAGMLAEGVYTVRWDGATAVDTETVEVTGGQLFTVPEARESDPDLIATKYPAADIRHYREVVETEFQTITGRSFVPRTLYLSVADFPAYAELLPVADVRSVAVVGGPGGTVAVDRVGHFALAPVVPVGTTGLEIAYGFTSVPEDIKRVGLLRLRWLLMAERSGIPDRATSFQAADGGNYTLATPGRAGSETGIPDVDAVLDDYRFKIADSVVLG